MSTEPRAIDCDVHPTVPDIKVLLPYLDPFWRDSIEDRGIPSLESISYPPKAPFSARPDLRDNRIERQQQAQQLKRIA